MADSAQRSPTFLVFALRPNPVLNQLILDAKSKTKAIAGPQTYLDHPPHLTLYVAAFDNGESVEDEIQDLVNEWTCPEVNITGWHHFSGDVLTGSQTLVCEIAESDKVVLRRRQSELIERIASIRNTEVSQQRYRPHFAGLSAERQQAVLDVGFPFVKDDWIPHLTVASIDPAQWHAVWQELEPHPPRGSFECAALELFELVDDFPVPRRKFHLDGVSSPT